MLAVRCRLLRGTFEADRADAPGVPEWPPHWMRLYGALVSVAQAGGFEDGLLRELEGAGAPEVRASPRAETLQVRRTAFVPEAKTSEPRHSTLPARTNASRTWARVVPRRPIVFFVWPELELSNEQRSLLARLCRRVPYLGRTTSPALVDLVDRDELDDLGWALMPARDPTKDLRFMPEDVMRVPFPGALDELRRAHKAKYLLGMPAPESWEIGDWIEYGYEEPVENEPGASRGPLDHMVVLAIEGRALDGRLAARITAGLRRAVRSRAAKDIAAIHGHHAGDQPQCCFAALPFVGSEHADGHLLGLAVVLPRELDRADAAVVAQALPAGGETMELTCGALGVLELRRLPPLELHRRAWGLRPERWQGPAARWVTAYPIVFDRYLKRRDDPEQELRRTVERSGYPTPTDVITSRYPLVAGALDLAPGDTVRRRGEQGFKPYRHAVFRFEEPLEGPVVIGSMRHYGLGLCIPLDESAAHADDG